MTDIRQQLTTTKNAYSGVNSCEYITIHQTGNADPTATAAAHANLQSRGNVRIAAWHYTCDDTEIVQSLPDTVQAWHAGDRTGNRVSIGVELCVNRGSDYAATIGHAVELVRVLITRHGIPLSHVVQHHAWSKKNCPEQIRAGVLGIDWDDFIALVEAGGTTTTEETDMPRLTRIPDGTIFATWGMVTVPLTLGQLRAMQQIYPGITWVQMPDTTVVEELLSLSAVVMAADAVADDA